MEHRLIIGGEQYLPFARSRVKVLRGLGLPYADQSFSIGGVTVRVRIEPGHEYIHIEGGDPIILSGVTRDGAVITLPDGTKTLRSYKPTANAWQYPLHKDAAKSPSSFHDEKLLGKAGAQYATLRPTMFSGRMVQAVQILMGRGIEVKYDFRWEKCHGITTGPDGTRWLVEISADGVRAMKFGLDSGSIGSKTDANKQATIMFGGIPNGTTFPVGDKLADAISSGKVMALRTSARMADFYGKRMYASTMGWSFNDGGTEAHNTCWQAVTPGSDVPDIESTTTVFTSYHYKLSINFFTNGDPPVAELDLVGSGRLTKKQHLGSGVYEPIPMHLYDFLIEAETPIRQQPIPSTEPDVEGTTPLIVCHINGVLEVLSVTVRGSTAYSYVSTRGEFGIPGSYTTTICSIPAGRSITYTSGGLNDEAYTLYSFSEASAVAGAEFDDTADGGGRGVVKAYADHTMTWALSGAPSIDNVACAYWGAYARDAFIKFRPVSTFQETYSGHSLEGWPGESAYYLDGVISGDMIALVGDYSGVSTVSVPHSVHTENVKGAVIVPGSGEPIDVYNDAIMRSYWWFYLTYSAFGSSSQQLSLNADGFHRHVGDLLNTESPENPMKEYSFIGYT